MKKISNEKPIIGINSKPITIITEEDTYKCYKNNKDRYLVFNSDGTNLGWKSFEELQVLI